MECIGLLTIRTDDARFIAYSDMIKNMDNVSIDEPNPLEDNDTFEPVTTFSNDDCLDVEGHVSMLDLTFKDLYNQANSLDSEYKVVLTLIFDQNNYGDSRDSQTGEANSNRIRKSSLFFKKKNFKAI
jgi:hypothetical protein